MEESVYGVFKTLAKVPVYILISYLVFDIFLFSFTYFKALGISYSIEQVAIENNYLPNGELLILEDLVQTLEDLPVVDYAEVIIARDDSGNVYSTNDVVSGTMDRFGKDARIKRQYGKKVTVGLRYSVHFVWPLDTREQTAGETGVAGWDAANGRVSSEQIQWKSKQQLEDLRQEKKDRSQIEFVMIYTVPGLKYYPDLVY